MADKPQCYFEADAFLKTSAGERYAVIARDLKKLRTYSSKTRDYVNTRCGNLGKEQVADLCSAIIPHLSNTVKLSLRPFPNTKVAEQVSEAIDDLLRATDRDVIDFRDHKPAVFYSFPGMSTEASLLLLWTLSGGPNRNGDPTWGTRRSKERKNEASSDPSDSNSGDEEPPAPSPDRGRKARVPKAAPRKRAGTPVPENAPAVKKTRRARASSMRAYAHRSDLVGRFRGADAETTRGRRKRAASADAAAAKAAPDAEQLKKLKAREQRFAKDAETAVPEVARLFDETGDKDEVHDADDTEERGGGRPADPPAPQRHRRGRLARAG